MWGVPPLSVCGGSGSRDGGRSRKKTVDPTAISPPGTLSFRGGGRSCTGRPSRRPMYPPLVPEVAMEADATLGESGDSGNVCVFRGGRHDDGGRGGCSCTRQQCWRHQCLPGTAILLVMFASEFKKNMVFSLRWVCREPREVWA